jgi:molecular chaperone DnaK (HSP70)
MDLIALLTANLPKTDLPDHPVRVLGIDLGTTNSTVAEVVWDPATEGPLRARCLEVSQETTEGQYIHVLVPSIVAIQVAKVTVGEGAKRLRSRAAELGLEQNRNLFYECKNDIGTRKTYHRAPAGFRSAAEIAGKVLQFLYNSSLESDPMPVAKTVVTVPASFQAAQRIDTLKADALAGLKLEDGDLLDEPVAAFLDYLVSKGGVELTNAGGEKKLVVFDFGGGTCDVAVFTLQASQDDGTIKVSPLSVSRYHRLGGGDIDAAILHEVLIPELIKQNGLGQFELTFDDKKKFIEPALLSVAESLKISLSTEISRLKQFERYDSDDREAIASKFPGLQPCSVREGSLTLQSPTLTAKQFEDLLKPFLDQDLLHARETEYRMTCSVFAPLQDGLDRAGLEPSEVDYCLMVGGSSLIPQVHDAAKEFFPGAQLLTYDDRDSFQTSVARGAAYHALARVLFGRGLVQPVSSDKISIRTATGEVNLIPKGASLPFPPGGGYSRTDALAVPDTILLDSLDLRLEVLAGEEHRILMSDVWTITGPVNRGEPLTLEYRLNENQMLDLRLRLSANPDAGDFKITIENPLTNVVNPNGVRLEIDETEERLRKGEIPRGDQPDTIARLGYKYDELGQREKALEYLRRAMAGKGAPDALILNKMGSIAGEMGDHERQEKFYREAASVSSWSGPWFNLALMQKQLGRIAEAIQSVERATANDRQAPYLLLRAMLAEKTGDKTTRDIFLDDALQVFDPISAQNDWELGWFLTAVQMSGDQDKVREIHAEQQRRARGGAGARSGGGLLPIEGNEKVDI